MDKMDKNFKIIEVFKADEEMALKLLWEEEDQISQYIVQSLDDPEKIYYPKCFIELCYGLGHKVVLHD